MNKSESNYKTVAITATCGNNVTSFSSFINLEFVPDEIILKYVCRTDADTANSDPLTLLRSNIIGNNIMYAFPDVANYDNTPLLRFKTIGQPIPNTANFEFVTISGGTPSNKSTYDTKIVMMLEFIKY